MTVSTGDGVVSGQIVGAYGRHYLVDAAELGMVECVTRGRRHDYACGDQVHLRIASNRQGVIEALLPRHNLLQRADRHHSKLLAANATQVIALVAAEPSFSQEILTRIACAASATGLRLQIVLNKADLQQAADAARQQLAPLLHAGYALTVMSAKQDIAALLPLLEGQTSVLVGQSGMGKSTLINALIPDAQARVGEISSFLDSGRHTTTRSFLYRLNAHSAIIDTPGLQHFGLAHLDALDIQRSFPEVAPLLGHCRFNDCRHRSEPGCAITEAVTRGEVAAERVKMMQRILAAEGHRL
jgi:ribosome biogenesis GTPase